MGGRSLSLQLLFLSRCILTSSRVITVFEKNPKKPWATFTAIRFGKRIASHFKKRFVRLRGFKGYITPIRSTLDRKDAASRMRKGLWGKGTVSFESVNYPGYFLRHQGFVLKLHKRSKALLYRKDDSFYLRRGFAKVRGALSLESVNYKGHYIRHCSFMLLINNMKRRNRKCNPKVFKADVSFLMRSGFVR